MSGDLDGSQPVFENCGPIETLGTTTVSSGDVTFRSPESISMRSGFSVALGAAFGAEIEAVRGPGVTAPRFEQDLYYRDGLLVATNDGDASLEKHIHDGRRTLRAVADNSTTFPLIRSMTPFGLQLTPETESIPGAESAQPMQRFTGHERDVNSLVNALDDLDYMHARYYVPRFGRFLSVDPQGQYEVVASTQTWNKYSYAPNNPITYIDPDGGCTDTGGRGARVCIQAFIPMRSFGGFAGDNRGARSDGGTFRTSQFLNVATGDKRALLGETFQPGISRLGPLARQASVADQNVLPTADGIMVSAAASDGLAFGRAPKLKYDLTLLPTESGGLAVSGTHTAFPSLKVWLYEDGKDPQLIYSYDATAENALEGLIDILNTLEIPQDE